MIGENRKINAIVITLCILLTAVLFCGCTSGSKAESSSAAEVTKPVIELPALPLSVKVKGGSASVTNISLSDYDENSKKIVATVSVTIDSADEGATGNCKVSYKIVNENDLVMGTGVIDSGEPIIAGGKYDGTIELTGLRAGMTYWIKFY